VKILKFFFLLLFLLLLVGGVGGFFVVKNYLQPVNPESQEKIEFNVPKGQSISRIGERLTEVGIMKHPLVFRLMVMKLHAEQKIQAGQFALTPSMTPEEVVTEMTKGVDDVKVTLLEGWRREEMGEKLAELDLPEFDLDEFLKLTEDKEGFLFPDTYQIQRNFTTKQVVSLLENTFEKKVEKGLAEDIKDSGKSLKEVITMASLIQREAKGEEQMKVVSGVLWKRVEINMALNVDATLQYIRGYDEDQKSWWSPPLLIDKERTSPYNTYKNPGLPPGPITNPGLDAIRAALHPTESDYLFYLHDTQGKIHFSKTLDEHNANVQKYLR
jgi:UPF0755 protein